MNNYPDWAPCKCGRLKKNHFLDDYANSDLNLKLSLEKAIHNFDVSHSLFILDNLKYLEDKYNEGLKK